MTHPASGNPTWQDYPDLSTPVTADALEAMEGALDAVSAPGPVVALVQNTAQNVLGSTWTAITFDSEDLDTAGLWSGSGNTLTIPAAWAGLWAVCGSVGYQLNTTGARLAALAMNGARIRGSAGGGRASDNVQTTAVTPVKILSVPAGATLSVHTYQTSSAASPGLQTALGELGCSLNARFLRSL